MRVTMATVWDRTSDVLAGRQNILVAIAAVALWLPAVAQQAMGGAMLSYAPTLGTSGAGGLVGMLSLVTTLVGLWGKLAIIAVASDPATRTGDAYRLAIGRLPLLIGLALLVGAVFTLLALPLAFSVAPYAQQVVNAGANGMAMLLATMSAGARMFFVLYMLALALVLLWAVVRLLALNQVVLDERAGIGSFRRSFEITRGHFWRLLGVLLLFGIVIAVAGLATQSVVGIVARLVAGSAHPAFAAFITTLFTAAVGAGGNVVLLVFVTQFYLLRREAPALS